jgi:hypothetical protein
MHTNTVSTKGASCDPLIPSFCCVRALGSGPQSRRIRLPKLVSDTPNPPVSHERQLRETVTQNGLLCREPHPFLQGASRTTWMASRGVNEQAAANPVAKTSRWLLGPVYMCHPCACEGESSVTSDT